MLSFLHLRSIQTHGILNGLTDMHCHLLPGVDDGVQTVEESLAALECLERKGVKAVWLTPHVMEELPNTTEELKRRFSALQAVYRGGMELNLAAEYMLDPLFEERLSNNDLLFLGENRLLVETSCFNPPIYLKEMLQRILDRGYVPIMAHPERYGYLEAKTCRELKSMGVKFQLNLLSITGVHGDRIKKKAEALLLEGLYDFAGSDMHILGIFRKYIQVKTVHQRCLPGLLGLRDA